MKPFFGVWQLVAIAGLGFLAPPCSNAGVLMYAVTQTGTFFTLDPGTLATSTKGTVAGTISLIGLSGNGTNLYTFDRNANRLLQIDAATANTLTSIDASFGAAVIGEGDFTFDTGAGSTTGFLASAQFPTSNFYSFALGSPGSNSLLHSDSNSATRIFLDGLVFGPSGMLFALQQGGANIYTVNTATGAPTLLGGTGIAAGPYSFGGLAFDSNSSIMYAVLANNVISNLYTIDTTTGAGTLVGAIPNLTNVDGLAFFDAAGPTPTPEPSTFFLIAAGCVYIRFVRAGRFWTKS